MAQLLIDVPDSIAVRLRQHAAAQGLTVSQYLADLLNQTLSEAWPPGFFEEVVGGWQGEPPERPPQGTCEPRERL